MPISINPQMMREIIMDHYNNPLHKSTPSDKESYLSIRMDSDSCIDDITIYLKIENDIVVKTYFDGIACTISTASTDILCDLILNKSKSDALYILEQYTNMIFEKEYNDEVLDEALVFANTHKQAARIKCATLGSTGLKELIECEGHTHG